jgi:signal transduction histidine kinase
VASPEHALPRGTAPSDRARANAPHAAQHVRLHADHTVQFYEDDHSVSVAAADFLSRGLTSGQRAIVIATPEHAKTITSQLATCGVDIDVARSDGRLTVLDARATLDSFMRASMPDPELFFSTVATVLGRRVGRAHSTSTRAYGEMVDLLWREGNTPAALRLEDLWNDLLPRHDVSLFCAYSMASFYRESDAERIRDICDRHTRIIPLGGQTHTETLTPHVELSVLRERTRSYEADARQREQLEQRLRDTVIRLQEREEDLSAAVAVRDLALSRERTAREEAECARADAERARATAEQASRAKSEFLAVMSHELRTPLNAIGGYAELMELGMHGPVTAQQRDDLDRIQRSQRLLLGLINEVLNYTRIESGHVQYRTEKIVVAELLRMTEALVSPQLRGKGVRHDIMLCPPDVVCIGDAERVQQVLINLLSNAAKFTRTGGMIFVDAERRGNDVLIHVRDTGIGIPHDKLAHIFEPFVQVDAAYTRTRDGIGLGLAISRDLARGMHGDLTVESTVGVGSTFTLRMPAA